MNAPLSNRSPLLPAPLAAVLLTACVGDGTVESALQLGAPEVVLSDARSPLHVHRAESGALLLAEAGLRPADDTGRVRLVLPDGAAHVLVADLPIFQEVFLTEQNVGPGGFAASDRAGEVLFAHSRGEGLGSTVYRLPLPAGDAPEEPLAFEALAPWGATVAGAFAYGILLHPSGALLMADASGNLVRVVSEDEGELYTIEAPRVDVGGESVDPVPVDLAQVRGEVHVALWGGLPDEQPTGRVGTLDLEGRSIEPLGIDFSHAIAIEAGPLDHLLVLSTGRLGAANAGAIVALAPEGGVAVLAEGIDFPTSMAVAPDAVLVTTLGGELLRFPLSAD